MTRDELIDELLAAGAWDAEVLIDTPTTLNAGMITEVRPGQADGPPFILLAIEPDRP